MACACQAGNWAHAASGPQPHWLGLLLVILSLLLPALAECQQQGMHSALLGCAAMVKTAVVAAVLLKQLRGGLSGLLCSMPMGEAEPTCRLTGSICPPAGVRDVVTAPALPLALIFCELDTPRWHVSRDAHSIGWQQGHIMCMHATYQLPHSMPSHLLPS
jgi:hypothetical protein